MFDYSLPSYQNTILPMYPDSNWYISNKTITLIDVMFSSKQNKHRTYYTDSLNMMTADQRRTIKQNMAQAAIRVLRYYIDNDNQYAEDPKNIHAYLFFIGWKMFVATAKPFNKPDGYYTTAQLMVTKWGEQYLDRLMDEIENPIPTKKKSKRKREPGYSKKQLDYLCNLD